MDFPALRCGWSLENQKGAAENLAKITKPGLTDRADEVRLIPPNI